MGNGNGEWGMGNGEWGNGEWGMGNGEWGMGNGEWGMGNGEWGDSPFKASAANEGESEETCGGGDQRQRGVGHLITAAVSVEGGAEAAEPQSHGETESVAQAAPTARRVLGDQAVVERLMHEVHDGEHPAAASRMLSWAKAISSRKGTLANVTHASCRSSRPRARSGRPGIGPGIRRTSTPPVK